MATRFDISKAVARDAVAGYGGLPMRRKARLTPPEYRPGAMLDLEVRALPDARKRPGPRRRRTKFEKDVVANNLFKAMSDDLYQGRKTGPIGAALPESWNPVAKAKYRPDIAGDAFYDSGSVQEMNTLDTRLPKFDKQWGKVNGPDDPNPFPIEVSGKISLR